MICVHARIVYLYNNAVAHNTGNGRLSCCGSFTTICYLCKLETVVWYKRLANATTISRRSAVNSSKE